MIKRIVIITFVIIISVIGGILLHKHYFNDTKTIITTDTVRVDSVVIAKPSPSVVYVEGNIVRDTVTNTDITLPTLHKVYEGRHITNDSNVVKYKAFVSGVKPNLDSLVINTEVKEHRQSLVITKYKKKAVNVGIQCGYGYSPIYKGFTPYIGIGFQINF